MQSRINALAAQQPTHTCMQLVLESRANELVGLHTWSETHMYLIPYNCSSYHDQQGFSTALVSGLDAV